jgi:hypothetical protein
MRGRLSLAALFAFAALSACGGSSSDSLKDQVDAAMGELPYRYELLPKLETKDYVTFTVVNPRQDLEVTFAYGLPGKGGGCPPFPKLPVSHRTGSKPAVAAGPEPLICLEDDAWRASDGDREKIVRKRISGDVAVALCKEAHDELGCFI